MVNLSGQGVHSIINCPRPAGIIMKYVYILWIYHIYIHSYIFTCIHTHIHICIYIYIYIHTYIHIYMGSGASPRAVELTKVLNSHPLRRVGLVLDQWRIDYIQIHTLIYISLQYIQLYKYIYVINIYTICKCICTHTHVFGCISISKLWIWW